MVTTPATVTLVVRFWEEDGVWNGEAEDLPVAAFGDTLEQAMAHLREAVVEHLSAVTSVGLLEETVAQLRASESVQHSLEDADIDVVLAKFSTPIPQLHDCHA